MSLQQLLNRYPHVVNLVNFEGEGKRVITLKVAVSKVAEEIQDNNRGCIVTVNLLKPGSLRLFSFITNLFP